VPTFSKNAITDFAVKLLSAGGFDQDEAELVAKSLVDGNLAGYDSHGMMRIPQYIDQIAKGQILPGAEFEVLREGPSLLAVDGHWGAGQAQAARMMQRLMAKANESGVAVGTMIQSAHIGRLGEYCETATAAGLVAMIMVNNHGAARRVAPPGGKAPRLSTNPIAVGIPNGDEPIVMDFGTCMIAEGKVRVMKFAKERCPEGLLLDSDGRPTTDPNDLYADPPGTILPLGGSQAYKGFALGMMVEIFSGALSGGVCAREVPINQLGNCVFMMVLDPAHFGGAQHFASEVSSLIEFVRGCPRVEGVDEITLAGDPERRTVARKLSEGIDFDEGNWEKITALAAKLGVDVPKPQ